MRITNMPKIFQSLLADECINSADIKYTFDNFFIIYKPLSNILAEKNVFDFPDSDGKRLACDNFFDDWFLYAVASESDYTYGLLKMREQEHDLCDGHIADGDTPGVTVSFISFSCEMLINCLKDPTDENRKKLSCEVNRVVAYRGQRHSPVLKAYFKNPEAEAPYYIFALYTGHIASFAKDGCLPVPECYKETVRQSILHKRSARATRLPRFIKTLNERAGRIVCDNENIYIKNHLDEYEALAILATHTGNTSVYSFAAEIEYHAKYLIPLAKIKIPFLKKSVYDSAIRADMTVGDTEFEGPAPFHNPKSRIVKRQYKLHQNQTKFKGELL